MSGGPNDRRLWADEGLLVWDGRALELYRTDGRTDGWRVDARTVERWVLDDPAPAPLVLKLYTTSGHLAAATIPPSAREDLEAILELLDRRRQG